VKKNILKNLSLFKNPLWLGLFLILAVVGYFLLKSIHTKHELERLERQLIEKKKNAEQFDIKMVSPLDVFKAINNDSYQLIDLRSSAEFQAKHIESSINIPISTINERVADIKKDKKIIIIDNDNSKKGKILVDHFQKQGLDIYYLEGGILKFAQENYPLITDGNIHNTADKIKANFISAKKVKEEMMKGKIFSFVDTRPVALYQKDHIKGSFSMPLETLEKNKGGMPTHTILLYDSDTTRSFKAGVKLFDMGISNFRTCSDDFQTLKKILLGESDK